MPSQDTSRDSNAYDFILVGAGSASCLLAARLSHSFPTQRILILEAGQHLQNDPRIQIPGNMVSLHGTEHDWQYISAPEPGLNGRRIKHPRGKVVGGTSTINSHSVVFPNTEWQDRVMQMLGEGKGREEWSKEGMKQCYERWQSEKDDQKDGAEESSVRVSFPRKLDVLQESWVKAFEELGLKSCRTGFRESDAGAVMVSNAIDGEKGERSHAGTAFLDAALKRGNVTLMGEVKVDKIVLDQDLDANGDITASGVQYSHLGKEHVVHGKEIIICAGTFESPALLERSGIGSRKVLEAANVPVRYELPGVGENLQDHLNCSLSREAKDEVPTRDEVMRNPELQKASRDEYKRSRTGRLAEGPVHTFAFTPLQMLETPTETQELEDLVNQHVKEEHNLYLKPQYSLIQTAISNPSEATATTFMLRAQRNRDLDSMPTGTPSMVSGNFITIVAMLAHPFSRGSCHITPDLSAPPEVHFNYLSHPLDVEIFARHVRLIDRLFQTQTYTDLLKPDGKRLPRSHPHPIKSLDDAKNILPINSATNYHPCGTCSMMREDLGGVVDEQLRVYGTRNIRVCDASVLPVIPRGNILTAVYAYAEKAAEILCR